MIKRREEIIEVQTGQEYQEKYGAGRVGGLNMDENVANANVENAGDQDVMISVESREREQLKCRPCMRTTFWGCAAHKGPSENINGAGN